MKRSHVSTLAIAAALLLSACVTINIYFPAAAAEKAADKIIDEVWQLQKKPEQAPAAPASKEAK
jgi:starvation-inducible outer membrane lipoprotein